VNDVVVLQQVRDQPEAVQHAMFAVDGPCLGDGDEAASHVNQSPAAQAPQHERAESNATIRKPDDATKHQHDHDVEDELGVTGHDRPGNCCKKVGGIKRQNRHELAQPAGRLLWFGHR
jgi:hypothetical protein